MSSNYTSKGYDELKAEYEKIEAQYLETDHAERVQQLFDSRIKNSNVDRIVIMGIGDDHSAWWQLAIYLSLNQRSISIISWRV